MVEISKNAETVKICSASLRVAILICNVEQAFSVNLMDSLEALAPKKKAGVVKTQLKLETAKIHAIVFLAKSSRHFESRSSLHVSAWSTYNCSLAKFTINKLQGSIYFTNFISEGTIEYMQYLECKY